MPTTLKEALKKGKLDEFIKEYEQDAPGDSDCLDIAIKTPARGKSKPAQGTSKIGLEELLKGHQFHKAISSTCGHSAETSSICLGGYVKNI